MGPTDTVSSSDRNPLVALASAHGFHCIQNEAGVWQISASLDCKDYELWVLQQSAERWILIVNRTPQMFLQYSEAIDFLRRWLRSQATSPPLLPPEP